MSPCLSRSAERRIAASGVPVVAGIAATRDPDHLTNVLRERLERTALPEPATAIALESECLLPLASRNLTLLPDAGQAEEAAAQLIERLRARLGDETVLGLKRCADHRPERAWDTCAPQSRDAPRKASDAVSAFR